MYLLWYLHIQSKTIRLEKVKKKNWWKFSDIFNGIAVHSWENNVDNNVENNREKLNRRNFNLVLSTNQSQDMKKVFVLSTFCEQIFI